MSYEKAVQEFAPCGIECARCVAFKDGEVVRLSSALKEQLHNFENMANYYKKFTPVFNNYDSFVEILEFFAKGSCPGCLFGESPNCSCNVKECHKEKNVDFCYQCAEYPCDKTNYEENLYKKWRANNDMMKEKGVEAFYTEKKSKHRY